MKTKLIYMLYFYVFDWQFLFFLMVLCHALMDRCWNLFTYSGGLLFQFVALYLDEKQPTEVTSVVSACLWLAESICDWIDWVVIRIKFKDKGHQKFEKISTKKCTALSVISPWMAWGLANFPGTKQSSIVILQLLLSARIELWFTTLIQGFLCLGGAALFLAHGKRLWFIGSEPRF